MHRHLEYRIKLENVHKYYIVTQGLSLLVPSLHPSTYRNISVLPCITENKNGLSQ